MHVANNWRWEWPTYICSIGKSIIRMHQTDPHRMGVMIDGHAWIALDCSSRYAWSIRIIKATWQWHNNSPPLSESSSMEEGATLMNKPPHLAELVFQEPSPSNRAVSGLLGKTSIWDILSSKYVAEFHRVAINRPFYLQSKLFVLLSTRLFVAGGLQM